jgi:hypothetical protein
MDADKNADDPKKLTNSDLYEQQMDLLKTFLKTGAITEAQYRHSADVLTEKMGPHSEQKGK